MGGIEVYGDGVITMSLDDAIYTPFFRDHSEITDLGDEASSSYDDYLQYMNFEFVGQQDGLDGGALSLESMTFDTVTLDHFSFKMNFTSPLLVS